MISLVHQHWHSVIFTIIGGYVTGWPLASARWYLVYLFGLVLVWTLPLNKRSQFWGYGVLVIGVLAKAYVSYLTPAITVQTIPIAMYKGKLVQQHPSFPATLTKLVHASFAKDIDIFSKNPKALPPPITMISSQTAEPILSDFQVSSKFIDRSKIWRLPIEVQQAFTAVPVVMAIQIKQADHGVVWLSDWSTAVFFAQSADQTILSHKGSPNGIALKDHRGSTLFLPLIDSPKSSWIYLELCPWAAYLPLLLLLAAVLLVSFTWFAARTLEPLLCLSFAFITICHSELHPYWPSCGFPYASLHSLSAWIHGGVWDTQAGQAPLWYLVNQLFHPISYFGYLLPMLCFWASAMALLQLLRGFFKPSHSYIIWGILLSTPWLARQGIGLHVYNPWHIVYSSLMLGTPLFLIGLLGYVRHFKLGGFKFGHGLAWVAASLCNPVILAGVVTLLLHKHLGRQRLIYLGVTLGLSSLANLNYLASMFTPVPFDVLFATMVNLVTIAYSPFLIIFGLIPNICMAFSEDITWRRFARVGLIMHGGFIASASIHQEAYLACTLSDVCSFIYLATYYEQFIHQYQRLTATSQ